MKSVFDLKINKVEKTNDKIEKTIDNDKKLSKNKKNTSNLNSDNSKSKNSAIVNERIKKRKKIAFWILISSLIVGGITFWQYASLWKPGVFTVTKIELKQYGNEIPKPSETHPYNHYLKFIGTGNNGFARPTKEILITDGTKISTVWGPTTAQLSIYIDVNLFRGFVINAQVFESTPTSPYGGIKISDYIFSSSTGIGTSTDPLNEVIISGTSFNDKSKSFIQNATAPVVPFNPLYTIISFLPMILLIGILFWSMKKMSGSTSSSESVFSMGKTQAKIVQSNTKFTDVAGIEEEKIELMEIVDYLKQPNKYAAMGARTPKGIMLYGPPGTGKTLLARAVAGEASVPFFQASGSSFEDMLVGVGAKRVRDLFSKASKSAPSIIFIDEIDSVASKRGKFDSSGGIGDQTINQLLAEMDGFEPNNGVVVIAATNRLDVLDPAVIRPGRFDRHISVNLPDIKERKAILKIHAINKNISSNVNLEDIARRTPGFSGAQLENILNEATLLAVRENKNVVTTKDIDEAIDRVIAGPAKTLRVITPSEQKQIAYHEAGHALVGLHTPGSDIVQKITIIPRGKAAGYTLSTPEKQELSIQKKSDLLSIIASTLGGRASEEIIYGEDNVSTGASNDLYKVTNIVKSMVTQLGMSDLGMTQFVPSEGVNNSYQNKFYSEETAQLIDKEINKIIKKQYEYAKNVIKKNRKELDLIVESLIILETITKPDIDYIHSELKLPKEALDKRKELLSIKKV